MKSKAPLSLMEQLIMLLVFALAAALCLQVFVLSGKVSRSSETKSHAVTAVQNAAEVTKSCRGDFESISAILGGSGTLTILTVSATLGGAVFGDHISPISDTTILASAGAQSNHVNHVNTQLPYAALVAVIAAISYVVAGLCATLGGVICCVVMWAVALVLFALAVLVLKNRAKKTAQ